MYHKSIIIVLLAISFLGFTQKSYAQLSVSDEEKAVFAFFKLANKKPDFEQWIVNSEKYQRVSKFDKDELLETEKVRLGWGFGTYDPTKDFIKIKSKIRLTTEINEEGKRTLNIRFVNNKQSEQPYFPFAYGNEWIAFIINDIENYKTITLKPEEVAKVKKYFYDSAPYEATIEMRLRPLSADGSKTLKIDGTQQWLMLGDIAYLKIQFYDEYAINDAVIWDYNAPWYLTESQKALLEMFKK